VNTKINAHQRFFSPVYTITQRVEAKMRRLSVITLVLILLPAAATFAAQRWQEDWEERDRWQRPADVMDALGLRAGSSAADIGAGNGYFSFRMAERVGAFGKVYAVDIDKLTLEGLRDRAAREKVTQIETIFSAAADPKLPEASIDAALIVNAYHEMREYDAMLQGIHRALKPGGRLGIIDEDDRPGRPRSEYHSRHSIAEDVVREDATRNGLRFLTKERGFHRGDRSEDWYFLVFERPAAAPPR
jgi:predicted methyltransferase